MKWDPPGVTSEALTTPLECHRGAGSGFDPDREMLLEFLQEYINSAPSGGDYLSIGTFEPSTSYVTKKPGAGIEC